VRWTNVIFFQFFFSAAHCNRVFWVPLAADRAALNQRNKKSRKSKHFFFFKWKRIFGLRTPPSATCRVPRNEKHPNAKCEMRTFFSSCELPGAELYVGLSLFAPPAAAAPRLALGDCRLLAQGAPKGGEKTTYLPTYLFLRFFEIFRSDFRKYFYGDFGLLMQRNGQKRDKKMMGKDNRKKVFFLSTFSAKSF
jgi:hypothetical protein